MKIKENFLDSQMQMKEKNGVCYLTFSAFEETGLVRNLFSTRLGGVSEGCLSTMNLSYQRGDKKENVDENFRRIAGVLNCEIDDFVFSDQTHTTNVKIVTVKDKGKGITKEKDYADIDGLITNEKGIVLSTFYADCVPLYFLDPIKKVIALSHSGWKGTVNKIGEKTIGLMREHFGCKKDDILAAIGPSICKNCYEVSKDVSDAFYREFYDSNDIHRIIYPKSEEKAMLDLWQANVAILKEAGLKESNISVANICTSCNKDMLFSHRGSNGKRGNLGAFLMLT